MDQVERLLMVSALPVLLSGCGLAADRDIRAYNTCLGRDRADAAVCDGPRQAYEVDGAVLEATCATNQTGKLSGMYPVYSVSFVSGCASGPLHPALSPRPVGGKSKGGVAGASFRRQLSRE